MPTSVKTAPPSSMVAWKYLGSRGQNAMAASTATSSTSAGAKEAASQMSGPVEGGRVPPAERCMQMSPLALPAHGSGSPTGSEGGTQARSSPSLVQVLSWVGVEQASPTALPTQAAIHSDGACHE